MSNLLRTQFFIFSILFFVLFVIDTQSYAQNNYSINNNIYGNVKLDSIWEPTIYLSHISSFDRMNTMSKSMIIDKSKIDSQGNFYFNTDYLPIKDNLYRLHISKKGASIASLIIGGKDENHFFLIANKKSKIKIIKKSPKMAFSKISVEESVQNNILNKINIIVQSIDSSNVNEGRVKSEFIKNTLTQKLRQIADTTKFPLVSLYALNKIKFESDIKNNKQFYTKYLDKWSSENSNYFKDFRNKIPNRENSLNNNLLVLTGIIISFLLGYIANNLIKKRNNKTSKLFKKLSIQERKIYIQLKEGKSNKEISKELNIGINTVKSHISNIYSKLNIKSRKDVINIE